MKKPSSPYGKYARFSAVVIQMGVIIGFFAWGGTYLDDKYETGRLWTIIGSLSGVAAALYLIIKEVIKTSKEDE